MIISQLTGGLGNQMFQYAFGFSESKKLDTLFKIHFVYFKGDTPREFELDVFNISAKIASKNEIKKFPIQKKWYQNLFNFGSTSRYSLVRENGLNYQGNFLNVKDNSLLTGYWQSEKYFKDFKKEIIKEFTFKHEFKEKNKSISKLITQSNSVSVHVRRGDYIENKETNAFHGICSPEYYLRAMKTIENKIKKPIYFFFSDDPQWVKENLSSKFESHYINWNKNKDSYIDMQLMSFCKHNIIANSSFSWWGAWLNQNSKKSVIAPKRWLNDSRYKIDDLIPSEWITL